MALNMVKDIVCLGDKIQLKKIKTNNLDGTRDNVYISQLLDFLEDDKAYIAMPIEKGHVIPLSIDEKYVLTFYSNKGLYSCNATIINRFKSDKIHVLVVLFTSELQKIQRREYYRLDCLLDMTYYMISNKEISLRDRIKNPIIKEEEKAALIQELETIKNIDINGTVIDLSGGGARFVSNSPLNKNDNVMISMNLSFINISKKIIVNGIIINSTKMINRTGFYEHRVYFKDILKEDRETIIKFIFEEERKQRKKEKGLD